MTVTFQVWVDEPKLQVVDRVENTRFVFETPNVVSTTSGDTDLFYFPVDAATRVETSALETPKLLDVYVREATTGEMLAQSSNGSGLDIGAGEYNVEVVTSEVKIYLHVESAVVVERGDDSVTIDFGDETLVTVGARSYHERPAHTVTVPASVGPAMEAVSTFGSALKTLTPERSYPTLRGHPPLLRLGRELEIPDDVDVPDTGVVVRVPPRWDRLFPVASLAYYLGARVVPTDDEPRLVTDRGFEHPLDGPGGFEETVARTLKQVFFLDCITRTEGYYRIELHERELTEPAVDLDFAALYDQSIAEQVEAYLGEEYDAIAPAMPAWKQTADVWPSPDQLKALPYAANDLALVRCPDLPESVEPNPAPKGVVDFFRSAEGGDGGEAVGPIISPEPTESLEHVWFGEGYPMGANKGNVEAYRRQFDAEPRDDLGISVAVVCNDPEMAEEPEAIAEFYGASTDRTFDVTHYREMTTGDLRELLQTEMDFLHYVGHVEMGGIECLDGMLDVNELEWAGPKAFILNGCESYSQAQVLVEKGSLGGVATLSRIGNQSAMRVGTMMARLLNLGYPLQAALSVARQGNLTGRQYSILGAGGTTLVRELGTAKLLEIERGDETFRVSFFGFATRENDMGTVVSVYLPGVDDRYMNTGHWDTFELSAEELDEYLSRYEIPVKLGDELYWSDEVKLHGLD